MLPISKRKAPIPAVTRPPIAARRRKYPFDDMKVGQHFFVPDKTKNTLSTHASTVGKKLGMKFETRLCWMKRVDKEWVPCEETERGAHQGIGVWRME